MKWANSETRARTLITRGLSGFTWHFVKRWNVLSSQHWSDCMQAGVIMTCEGLDSIPFNVSF